MLSCASRHIFSNLERMVVSAFESSGRQSVAGGAPLTGLCEFQPSPVVDDGLCVACTAVERPTRDDVGPATRRGVRERSGRAR